MVNLVNYRHRNFDNSTLKASFIIRTIQILCMPDRRKVLLGLTTAITTAGCATTSGSESEKQDQETQWQENPEEESESGKETNLDSIRITDYEVPNEVQIGNDYSFKLWIENTGETDLEYTAPLYARFPEAEWEEVGELRMEVEAGTQKMVQSDVYSGAEYIGEMSLRIGELDLEETILFTPRVVDREKGYTSPTGISITSELPEFAKDKNDNRFIYIYVEAENKGNGVVSLPDYDDFSLLSDGRQYPPSDFNDLMEGDKYESTQAIGGAKRTGWVVFNIDDEFSISDYALLWAGSDDTGQWVYKIQGVYQ